QGSGHELASASSKRKISMHQILATQRATASAGVRSAISDNVNSMASGAASSVSLTEQCLARISDPAGEGKRAFVKVWADAARAAAKAQDSLRRIGQAPSPIAGMPVSVKDMLDVAGEITLAGTKAHADAPPATQDAPVIRRLKSARAVL